MRNKQPVFLLIILLSLSGIHVFAQAKIITGKITDAITNTPLSGVSVTVKNTTTGTVSDAEGSFQISVDEGAMLVISYVGYADQTVSTKGLLRSPFT